MIGLGEERGTVILMLCHWSMLVSCLSRDLRVFMVGGAAWHDGESKLDIRSDILQCCVHRDSYCLQMKNDDFSATRSM